MYVVMYKCGSVTVFFVLLSVCYNYLVLIIIIMYSYMINIIIIITHNINSYIYDNKLREDSIIICDRTWEKGSFGGFR